MVEELIRANDALEGLMEEGGVVGALATERYFLNNRYMQYLTGNGQEPLWQAMNSGFTIERPEAPVDPNAFSRSAERTRQRAVATLRSLRTPSRPEN